MIRAACVAFAALVWAASTHAHDGKTAKIGSMNFGADAFRMDGELVRELPEWRRRNLAGIVAALAPDVLAVSELVPEDAGDNVAADLARLGHCYKYLSLPQTSQLNVGFLHKCSVAAANPILIPDSDAGSRRHRKALAVEFQVGAFDFTGIAVHMKSGRDSSDRRTRNVQVEAIWEWVKNTAITRDKDVIIIGDYNMKPSQDQENFAKLNPEDYLSFPTSDELESRDGYGKVFSHISRNNRPGNLLDGMGIAGEHTQEYVSQSIEVAPVEFSFGGNLERYKRGFTDHLPVLGVFRIETDDD